MAGREQKQSRRSSLSLGLLSPKKKAVTPNKSLYISKPINSYGPSGERRALLRLATGGSTLSKR